MFCTVVSNGQGSRTVNIQSTEWFLCFRKTMCEEGTLFRVKLRALLLF